MFEPVWNNKYIEHIQITAAETVGVEDRGGYYEQAGALRCESYTAITLYDCHELPVFFLMPTKSEIKVDVLNSLRKIEMKKYISML